MAILNFKTNQNPLKSSSIKTAIKTVFFLLDMVCYAQDKVKAPYGTFSDPKKPIKVPKIRILCPKLRIFCDLSGSCGPRGHLRGAKPILTPNICIQTKSQEVCDPQLPTLSEESGFPGRGFCETPVECRVKIRLNTCK